MAAGRQAEAGGIVGAVKIDLARLHETWMELLFPRQRDAADTVLGKWTPTTRGERIAYRLWGLAGGPVVGVLYPLALVGVIVRFQVRRLDGTAARIGLVGVVVLSVALWGGLAALARYRLELAPGGAVAVMAASGVAILAAALAVEARSLGGRLSTVAFAYPLAMTAVFLPPVVAALYSPRFAAIVFPRSDWLAQWLLANVLDVAGIRGAIVRNFEREGFAYVLMWFGLAVPIGWVLGTLVSLADYVRPRR